MELLIPLQRTRVMMKGSPDVEFVSADSAVCLSKATEMFIRELVSAAYSNGEDSQFTYKNLSNAQSRIPRYGFLADVLPQKISAREWIDKYKAEFDASCL
ncbi:unnamed protein product [Calicophoron daubneyi]|uniref:Transcription factor CBF/NF-Y/archaeal histone domain-containing protein n=1 Tax=Calicophoron daubneyi TaxID=300641 RepID=A0AAV2THW5_CALDB